MTWHTDKTRLSYKSDAFNLFTIMVAEPIKDEIMHWLTPMDVIQFTIGTGVLFSEKDMAKYTSVFRYVITDRRWLRSRMLEGFHFTILSPYITELMNQNRIKNHAATVRTTNTFCVIVTKNGHFVPCTMEFAPSSVFWYPGSDRKAMKDTTETNVEPQTRCMRVTGNEMVNTILCPLSSQSTYFPLFLNNDLYARAIMNLDMCMTLQGERGKRINTTQYTHATQGRDKIVTLFGAVRSNKYAFKDLTSNLFSVTMPSGRTEYTNLLYRINRCR